MNNHTSPNIIHGTVQGNSLEIANYKDPKRNKDIITIWSSKTQSFELLMNEVDNFPDFSLQICQNWLKAHETEFFCSKNIQQYTKIVVLLKDIVKLIEGIKSTAQYAQLQRQNISETIGNIVSSCLDIEPEQVTPTANLANDLGIDSLDWLELLITLEEAFCIKISDEIAGTLTTVQQLIDCVILIVQKENRLSPQL
jgi:acyl carrier protein